MAGAAGEPSSCDSDCDDANECTTDTCVGGECVSQPVEAGSPCGVGRTCDTQAVCVRCRDTAAAKQVDEGCSAGAPVCTGTGLAAVCTGCTTAGDCNDNNECTTDTCVAQQCVQTAVAKGEACTGGTCNGLPNAPKCVTCGEVALITASTTKGNGSFEQPGTSAQSAQGWIDSGNYYLVYANVDGPFDGATGNTSIKPGNGSYFAWLGGPVDAGVSSLTTTIDLPAGSTTLTLIADTNFQTKNPAATNKDGFEVRLLDGITDLPIGMPVFSASPATAQTGTAHAWTTNGINKTADVTAQAGKTISVMFWSSVDATDVTDFFFDNVRVSATVCQ